MRPELLYKILGIIVGIIIWKTIVTSYRAMKKVSRELREEEEEGNPASAARLDLEEQWRQAAKRLSCTFDPGAKPNGKDASITGTFSGHAITIKRFGHNYVRYFAAFRRTPGFQVCVVRDLQSIAERILEGHPIYPSGMFFSSQEPVFYCSAESEAAFDRFLDTPSNRSAVLNLVRFFPSGMFNPEGVSVRLRAATPDPEVIRRMIAIADTLENPSQSPMPDLLTAPKKDLVAIPPVSDFLPGTPAEPEPAPKRFPPIRIGGSLDPFAAGTRADASRAAAAVEIPPEKAPRASVAEEKPVQPSAPEEPPVPTPEPVPPPADRSLTVESVCAALFTKSFPGAEERAAFDAMKGRRVSWSGELLTVMPFSMDFVFGSSKGVKATFLICNMVQGQSGIPAKIKAVAAFPPEFRDELAAAKGKIVAFSGDLLKFEPFAREIYLQNAAPEA